jgi:hypothetical protein
MGGADSACAARGDGPGRIAAPPAAPGRGSRSLPVPGSAAAGRPTPAADGMSDRPDAAQEARADQA